MTIGQSRSFLVESHEYSIAKVQRELCHLAPKYKLPVPMPIVQCDFFSSAAILFNSNAGHDSIQWYCKQSCILLTRYKVLHKLPVLNSRPPFPAVRTTTLLSNYWTKVNEHLPSWRALVIIFMLAARVFLVEPQLEKLK
jgi:hypothetical protein